MISLTLSVQIFNKTIVTFLLTFLILLIAIGLIAIRIIVLPEGEFHGTCSTNNEFRYSEEGSCPVCGKTPEESCPNEGGAGGTGSND